jgi:hypothetical protein
MNYILAAISIGGEGFINQVLTFLLMGIAVAILYAMGYWFATRPKVPPIALQIWTGIFVLLIGILLINFVMGLAGHSFIKF